MPIDPSDTGAVSDALAKYLGGERPGATLAEPPTKLSGGFDTAIYGFRLAGDALDEAWRRSLILRLYREETNTGKATHEFSIQRWAAERGYPALDPLLLETGENPFGLPFMLAPRIDGGTLLSRIIGNPLRARPLLAHMGRAHADLHRMAVDGAPLDGSTPLIDRELASLRAWIERAGLHAMAPHADWLEARSGAVRDEQAVVTHNDFHPLNILVDGNGAFTVIDWSNAALGDRHCDVARTTALFWFAKIAANSAVERVALQMVLGLLARWYLQPYRSELPVDDRRLSYWKALHALNGWVGLREIEQIGIEGARGNPDAAHRIRPGLAGEAERFFRMCQRVFDRQSLR